MLDTDMIRTQMLLVAEPGPRAEFVIRKIVAEAERHAREHAEVLMPEAEIRRRLGDVRRAIRAIG
jgi:hypothetical protein